MKKRTLFGPLIGAILLGPISAAILATGPMPTRQVPALPVTLPDTPVGRCAAAYFKAFNAGDEAMRAFIGEHRSTAYIDTNPIESQMKFYRTVRESSGDLTVERFTAVSDAEMIVVAGMTLRPGETMTVRFRVQSAAPHYLDVLNLSLGVADTSLDDVVIDAAPLERTINALAALLRKSYVSPQVGEELASLLLGNKASGRYAGITNGVSLAARLTADLFARTKDAHLNVRFGRLPGSGGARTRQAGPGTPDDGVRQVRILDGNIGYIRLNRFAPPDQAQAAIAKAMATVRPASALVLDLRYCSGGDPETVERVAGYLFDTRTLLATRHSRLHEGVREFRSRNIGRTERFGSDKPVYVLTGRQTASAAEMFALALQELKRAIVVGEKTAASGHAAIDMAVTDLFWVRMPYALMLGPISKRNWEGTGVTPDIQTPEDAALDAALQDAWKRTASKGTRVERHHIAEGAIGR